MPESSENESLHSLGTLPDQPRRQGAPARGTGDDPGPPDEPDAIERSETFRVLADAIDRQLVVVTRYGDEPEPRRICPDRIGIDPHDQYQVEAFQLSGPSASGTGTESWKCFHLHRLEIVGTETEGWATGPRESARSRCFAHVVHPTPGTE
jgi:hypothetical protein